MPLLRNDATLLAAFRAGRREALGRVYRAYVQSVERYVRALARASGNSALGQASAVADLLQEIFVRAFSPGARDGYDGLRDFGPYLNRIAHNCFVDVARATGREILKQPEEMALVLDDADPEQDNCDPRTLSVLTAYLGVLPAPLRGIYEQRFVLGHSQDEAAAASGLSRRAIRTGEQRLRRGLRKALVRAGISLRELEEPAKDSSTRIPAPAVLNRGRS
jgi:RNA polymerase sigma factor (sigma-70 family)